MEPARLTPDCLDDAAATAFIEGLLSEQEVERVEAHVDRCPDCRQHLVRMVRARTGGAHAATEPADPDRRLLAHGTLLGRYQIVRVVGLGSMGVVYAAYDAELRRDVAIKVVRAHANQDRLLREAHALARLRHPNVVTVHDVGTADDRVFIVMELIHGTTLTERVKHAKRTDELVELFVQAARGLAAAHAAGLVHRDFKPDNVLVGDDGRVCVTDFGLARGTDAAAEQASEPDDGSRSTTVTRTGAIVGTPVYMAPEQHLGGAVDARSDQFSFCVALFEALYGHRPFDGGELVELARNVTRGAVVHVPGERRVPRRLARLVARGLAIAPDDRYPDMAALVAELGAARRSRMPIAVAALAVTVAIGLVIVESTRRGDSCADSAALVDEVWGPGERTAQLVRFGVLRPREASMIEASARLVDNWSASWRLTRRAACTDDTAQRAARLGCLDQELVELRAQVAVWRDADADVVDHAIAAAGALPAPNACDAQTARPIDPAIGVRVAKIKALDRAGLHARAKLELPALLPLAEATGNPASLAAALVAMGRIEHAVGELDLARTHLSRAAREAGLAADDATLFEALVTEASVVIDQGRPLDSLGLLSAAEALSARAKLDRTEALARNRGAALTAAGRVREGIVELQHALAIVEARAARDPGARTDVAAVLAGIAAAQIQQYQYAVAHDLLVRVLAIEQSVYGADHPELGKTLHDLATTEARLGKYDDALAHLDRARAIFVAAYGERNVLVGETYISIASALAQSGKHEQARPQFEKAYATLSAVLPPDHASIAAVEEGLGVNLAQLDDCKAAIPHHEHAIAILDRIGRGGPDLANELINLGTCLSDVGRLADARQALDRGLAGMDAAGMPEVDHSEGWAVLADLEWKDGHHARAIELARKVLAATEGVDRPDIKPVHDFIRESLATWTK